MTAFSNIFLSLQKFRIKMSKQMSKQQEPFAHNQAQSKYQSTRQQQRPSDKKQNQKNCLNRKFQHVKAHLNNDSSEQKYNVESLPIQINELIKKNKFLQKQNAFLKQELQQKHVLVKSLRQQIYQSILEENQNKMNCLKVIEEESQSKARQIVRQKMTDMHLNNQENLQLKDELYHLQSELKRQKKANQILAKNVVQLKQYIIQAMDEKDLIISELKSMILEPHSNTNVLESKPNGKDATQKLNYGQNMKFSDQQTQNVNLDRNLQIQKKKKPKENRVTKAKIVKNC